MEVDVQGGGPWRRWRARALTLWASTRAWAFVGALCTRGAGFIASFSLARFAGPEALALYVSTVVTAAVVSTPLATVLFNGGTLAASASPSAVWSRRLLRASMGLAGLCLLPLALVFVGMQSQVGQAQAGQGVPSMAWVLVAGLSALGGQVMSYGLTGLLNGLGAQLPAARQQAVLSTLLMPLSLPSVYFLGLQGACAVLVLSSWLPVLMLWQLGRRSLGADWRPADGEVCDASESAWHVMVAQLRAGVPNAIALIAAGAGSWYCSIYLVQHHLGPQGVAVLAVATQWTTLILMPATSWGGVVLRELAHLRLQSDSHRRLLPALSRLMLRNVAVTGAVAAVVLLAMHWIEAGYRLQGLGLPVLMAVSTAAALVSSANGVLERALITWQRQWQLMAFSFVGLAAQVGCTLAFISTSLTAVQWGLMLSVTLSGGLSLWFLQRTTRGAPRGREDQA